jgi:putative MATE family efflux protein
VLALGMQSLVAVAETSYIGRLGTEPLAAMALVFPLIMLTQMLSSGAMGGGVSSAISRALGAGDRERAEALAMHALLIGAIAGVAFSGTFLYFGPDIFRLLGGSGNVIALANSYATTFFSGALAVWLFNSLVSIVRGTGNMRLPSLTIFALCILQIVLGFCLALGMGPVPRLGLPGVALAQILAVSAGAAFLIWYMASSRSRLHLFAHRVRVRPDMLRDILKVGAVACLSPIQSILVVILLARLATGFGTEALAGFGIGIRLELLLVPIAFAIGVACVPMVGMAIGSGDIRRARRVAWTGAALAATMIGAIGLLVGLMPNLWGGLFTGNPAVLRAVAIYLGVAGLGFPAYGLGLCLYFASQGSGQIVGPVLAGTVRLAVVIVGGWWLMPADATFIMLAWLVAAAMIAYGATTALSVLLTRWRRN